MRRVMKNRLVIAAGALFLVAAGCQKTPGDAGNPATATVPPTNNGSAATPLTNDDLKFVNAAAQGGMLEVELGSKAAQMGTSADVKTFGNHMVTDHSKADAELKALAMRKGVSMPTQLDSDHLKKVNELTKLSGAKFDSEYAKDMVDDHEEDVSEFEKASKDLKDPDLRQWAASTLPTLKSHLEMAKDVKAKTAK
jgi:putative membrane protein